MAPKFTCNLRLCFINTKKLFNDGAHLLMNFNIVLTSLLMFSSLAWPKETLIIKNNTCLDVFKLNRLNHSRNTSFSILMHDRFTMNISEKIMHYLDLNRDYIPERVLNTYITDYNLKGSFPEVFAKTYMLYRPVSDFEKIEAFLPNDGIKNILDIGGGIGGVSLLLQQKYSETSHLSLIEQSQRHLNNQKVKPLDVAREFFLINGIKENKFTLIDSKDPDVIKNISSNKYDLIVSFRALGFMFDLDIYYKTILEILRPGGILIFDIRNIEGLPDSSYPPITVILSRLRSDFSDIKIISHTASKVRVIAIK